MPENRSRLVAVAHIDVSGGERISSRRVATDYFVGSQFDMDVNRRTRRGHRNIAVRAHDEEESDAREDEEVRRRFERTKSDGRTSQIECAAA